MPHLSPLDINGFDALQMEQFDEERCLTQGPRGSAVGVVPLCCLSRQRRAVVNGLNKPLYASVRQRFPPTDAPRRGILHGPAGATVPIASVTATGLSGSWRPCCG